MTSDIPTVVDRHGKSIAQIALRWLTDRGIGLAPFNLAREQL